MAKLYRLPLCHVNAGGRAGGWRGSVVPAHNAGSERDEIRLPLEMQRPGRNHRLWHTKAMPWGRAGGGSIVPVTP